MTVGFDDATHHAGDAMGLKVIKRGFGDGGRDGVIGVIVDSSLLRGVAVSRLVLGRSDTWARFRRLSGLASTGGDWRGRRRASIVGTVRARHIGAVGSLGSELRNSRTGELVGSVGEGVDKDTGVSILVGTRESNELVGAGSSGLVTANVDLDAGGVKLGTSRLISQVKGDDLVTEKISTASEGRREREGMGLSVDCKSLVSIVY